MKIFDDKDVACIWERLNEIEAKLDHHIGRPRHVGEDDDHECTCEPRKREEKKRMVTFCNGKAYRAYFGPNRDIPECTRITHCIHCKLPIKRSLLD